MILDKIISKTKEEVERLKSKVKIEDFLKIDREIKDVKSALRGKEFKIIAEIKKASPSKGVIRADFNPIEIAKIYNQYADAMSILTEPHFFLGNVEYLKDISKFAKIPLLRKDFIVDKFQVAQSYYLGADFILLIAKALDEAKLKELFNFAKSLGLEALVEIHDEEDLKKALNIEATIIGFNHRNLETFEMDMNLSEKLMPLLPKDVIVVAESGISNKEIIQKLHSNGVDAFLIGEYFMREKDIKKGFEKLR